MQLAFTLQHHDLAYVDKRGGIELLTHLRGASERTEFRRAAVDRAWLEFERVSTEARPEAEVGGLGLVVLQRSLLILEDFGGLLHALSGASPWTRLRSAGIPQLDEAYDAAIRDPPTCFTRIFRLAQHSDLEEDGLTSAECAALTRMRSRLVSRWTQMLQRAAALWRLHRNVAKATMHGFPVLAGAHVVGPPGAGDLKRLVSAPPQRPWALAVTSVARERNITTTPTIVRLDRSAVAEYRRVGRSTARLYAELAAIQVHSITGGHRVGIPTELVRACSSADEHLIVQAQTRGAGPDDRR
jgi:hypothetical protein